mmetsp:Transcript_12009/g.22947  ORF Transcript_12009/g.22947 Transcript_12009/m.22947 type:complete len:241 (-) Transcript_12009:77-799(-)
MQAEGSMERALFLFRGSDGRTAGTRIAVKTNNEVYSPSPVSSSPSGPSSICSVSPSSSLAPPLSAVSALAALAGSWRALLASSNTCFVSESRSSSKEEEGTRGLCCLTFSLCEDAAPSLSKLCLEALFLPLPPSFPPSPSSSSSLLPSVSSSFGGANPDPISAAISPLITSESLERPNALASSLSSCLCSCSCKRALGTCLLACWRLCLTALLLLLLLFFCTSAPPLCSPSLSLSFFSLA